MKYGRILAAIGSLVFMAGCAEDMVPGGMSRMAVTAERSLHYSRTVGMRRQPPLHERGVKSVGLLYEASDHMVLHNVGITIFENQRHEIDTRTLIPAGGVRDLFVNRINTSGQVEARVLSPAESVIGQHIKWSPALQGYRIGDDGAAILGDLRAAGLDALLIVWERERPDLIGQVELTVADKGLYHRTFWSVYAFGIFEFLLIDTASGEEMENSRYVQVSMKAIPDLKWQGAFESYPATWQDVIVEAVKERVDNNVTMTLQLLKIIPGEDGEYLIYDPETEGTSDDYPQ